MNFDLMKVAVGRKVEQRCPCSMPGIDGTKAHRQKVAIGYDGITDPFVICINHVHQYLGVKYFLVVDIETRGTYVPKPLQATWNFEETQ